MSGSGRSFVVWLEYQAMLSLEQQNLLRDAYRLRSPGWRPATEVYAELAHTYAAPGAHILDLGCGRGGLVEQLGLPPRQLFGVDADWSSLHQHRLANMPRAVATTDALPLPAAHFDLVLGSWLLEHLSAPQQTLAQVRRVLRPGGIFLFITPNSRHPLALLNTLFGRLESVQALMVQLLYGRAPADTFPTRYLANSHDQLHTLARQSGLELVRLEFIPDPTYLALRPVLYAGACRLEESLPHSRYIHLVGLFRRPAPEG